MSSQVIAQQQAVNPLSQDPMVDNQFGVEEPLPQVTKVSEQMQEKKASQEAPEEVEDKKEHLVVERQPIEASQEVQSKEEVKSEKKDVLQSEVKFERVQQKARETAKQVRKKQISQEKRVTMRNRISRPKLKVRVPSPQKLNQPKVVVDMKDLEGKIKQIAKQIRSKVKKDEPRQIKMRSTEVKVERKTKRKDIILSPINNSKVTNEFSLTSPSGMNFEQSVQIQEQRKEKGQSELIAASVVKNVFKRQILDKVNKHIEKKELESRVKIKLDPIKHHYPITSFRKSVLKEQKSLLLKDIQREKEKEQKLLKRKEIFNNSRYQRYATLLRKNHQPIDKSLDKNASINQEYTASNVFSLDFTLQNPEGNHDAMNEGEEKQKVKEGGEPSSIQELDNLMKMVNDSNESYLNKFKKSDENEIGKKINEEDEKQKSQTSEKQERKSVHLESDSAQV